MTPSQRYYRANRDRLREGARQWRRQNPGKKRAQNKAYEHYRGHDGSANLGLCACGRAATDLHHDDYRKALEVRELCRRCHRAEHPRRMPNGGI